MFLLFEFCCGTPPSCLKVMGGGHSRLYAWHSRLYGGGLQHFSVSPRPLGPNWDFELGLTGLGLGLGGLGTMDLGPGLDNKTFETLFSIL